MLQHTAALSGDVPFFHGKPELQQKAGRWGPARSFLFKYHASCVSPQPSVLGHQASGIRPRISGLWGEIHRRAVQAIAKSGGLGTIGEDMAEMRIAFGAANFGAGHEM